MASRTLRLPRPFTGGLVTDLSAWEIAPDQASELQDAIQPRGIVCQRSDWSTYSSNSPLGAASALAGVLAVDTGGVIDAVVSDVAGRLGLVSGGVAFGTAHTSAFATPYLPRAYYGGEWLLCPQDGQSPMLRYAGRTSTPTTPVGNVTFTAGSTVVNWASGATNFLTMAPVDSYIALPPIQGTVYRVVAVDGAATFLSVATPLPVTVGGAGTPWLSAAAGHIGLATTVQDQGTVTFTAGSAAVTGRGTVFNIVAIGQGIVRAGDFIAQRTAGGAYYAVLSIGSATGLTLSANATGTVTNTAFRILRSAVGREACVHQARLFWTGVEWAPNRLYYSPVAYDLGRSYNERENYTSNFVEAAIADYRDVPAPHTPGRIEALLSTGDAGPLLVLRNDSAYGLYGDAANPDIRLLADGAGCVDLRSAVSSQWGQFWAGRDGIYRYAGGTIADLTAGKRNREWRALMQNRTSTALVSAGVVEGHLVVGLNDYSGGGTSVCWVYDLIHDCWMGNLSGVIPRYMSGFRPTPYVAANTRDDIFWITDGATQGNRRLATLASAFYDEGAASQQQASFVAQTGFNLIPLGQLGRPIGAKVVYELASSGNVSTLTVKVGKSVGFDTAATLAEGAAGGLLTSRVRVSSGTQGLGVEGRHVGVRLEKSGGSPTRLRIHQLELVHRTKRVPA